MVSQLDPWLHWKKKVEPFSCPKDGPHLGSILVPLCKVVPFSTKIGWLWLHFPRWTHFSSTFKKWSHFSKRLQGGAFWLHFFFSVVLVLTIVDFWLDRAILVLTEYNLHSMSPMAYKGCSSVTWKWLVVKYSFIWFLVLSVHVHVRLPISLLQTFE